MNCPYCGSGIAWRNGRRNGCHRWLCRNCGREYLDQNYSEHDQTNQPSILSTATPTTFLSLSCTRQSRPQSAGLSGLDGEAQKKEKGEMQTCKQLQNSDLLKDFPSEIQAKILEFTFKKINKGRSESTVRLYIYNLRYLLRAGADLHNPESVEQVIAREKRWNNRTKAMLVTAYKEFLKFLGVAWDPPIYKFEEKIPFIPLETEIDQFIAGSGRTLSPFLQFLKDSMARFGEAAALKWVDIDFERHIIAINDPEKHSTTRVFKASPMLMDMLNKLPRKGVRVFPKKDTLQQLFLKQRKRLAFKLNNPRLFNIKFHTFRHWGATMLYHKTRDPFLVQRRLGHKNIRNTQIYVQINEALFPYQLDEFHSATAQNVEDAKKLIEVGFEYVATFQDIMMFRKRR